jgi:hypothetical protein
MAIKVGDKVKSTWGVGVVLRQAELDGKTMHLVHYGNMPDGEPIKVWQDTWFLEVINDDLNDE